MTCLTCKHEPMWSQWSSGMYIKKVGYCRRRTPTPDCARLHHGLIFCYTDGSGMPKDCPTWEGKQ